MELTYAYCLQPVTQWVPRDIMCSGYKWSQLLQNHYLQNVGKEWEGMGWESLTTPTWLICSFPTPSFMNRVNIQKCYFGSTYSRWSGCLFSSNSLNKLWLVSKVVCILNIATIPIFYTSYNMSFQPPSIQCRRSVESNSLPPHELQHTRPLCPSPTPRAHSNSCP